MTTEQAREKIEKAIEQNGPYSHNIIGLALSSMGDYNEANKLIDEFNLTTLYSIQKIDANKEMAEEQEVKRKQIEEEEKKQAEALEKKIQKEEVENKRKEQIKKNFEALTSELNKLHPGWIIVPQNYGDFQIEKEVEYKSNKLRLEISRETVYCGGSVYASSYALRISTSNYDIKANKLRKDFGDEKLVGSLDKKSEELLRQWKEKVDSEIQKEESEMDLSKKIIDTFSKENNIPVGIAANMVRGGWNTPCYERGKQVSITLKNVKEDKIKLVLTTSDGVNYCVKKVGTEYSDQSFDIETVKKMIEFFKEAV